MGLQNSGRKELFPGIETVASTLPCSPVLGEPGQLPVTESAVTASGLYLDEIGDSKRIFARIAGSMSEE